MEATLFTLKWLSCLWLVVICIVGFALGFGHALALVVATIALCWLYCRIVPVMDVDYGYRYMEVK